MRGQILPNRKKSVFRFIAGFLELSEVSVKWIFKD